MDFWASLEHKLKYKKEDVDFEGLTEELRQCATESARLDEKMQDIRREIDMRMKEEPR